MANNTGLENAGRIQEAVCIETKKVYDSCRDKECIEDLRVYFTPCGQDVINNSCSVKPKSAEVIWSDIDVEPVAFNKGYYTVNIRFYFKVCVEACVPCQCKPVVVEGLAVYDKKAMLFGSEGSAKLFSSKKTADCCGPQSTMADNMPEASVELVDPVLLASKLLECNELPGCCCQCQCGCVDVEALPSSICGCFDGAFVIDPERKLYVTLGLFTIIRLSRSVQLLMPVYDFCIPENESGCDIEEPCDLFQRFQFPLDEFFPPASKDKKSCCCD